MARSILPRHAGRITTLLALIGLGAALSGFMNNVGAMALLMPIAVQLSARLNLAPGQILMPLAFGTILGGMTTLVGTPPNLIVSGFREEAGLGQFAMFDFAPVGIAVATLGVLFVALIGWRLVPARKSAAGTGFDTGTYLTEVRVPDGGKAVSLTLRDFEAEIEDSGAQIIGLVRNEVRLTGPHGLRRIKAGDVLVLQADVDALAEALSVFGIQLEAQKSADDEKDAPADDASEKVPHKVMAEAAIRTAEKVEKTAESDESDQRDEDC